MARHPAPLPGRGLGTGIRPLLVALLLLGATGTAHAPTAAAAQGVEEVGSFRPSVVNPASTREAELYVPELRLRVDPDARVLYTVDREAPAFVAAYDLDSLRPLSRHGVAAAGAASSVIADPDGGRLLIATGQTGSGATTALQAVAVPGRGSPAGAGRLELAAADLGGAHQTVIGIARQHGTPYAYLLSVSFADVQRIPGTAVLTLVDLTGLSAGTAKVLDTKALPDCAVPAYANGIEAPIGYSAARRSVFLGCEKVAVFSTDAVPTPAGVARVAVTAAAGQPPTLGAFELYPLPSDVRGGGVWDPHAERLLLQALSEVTRSVYTFDTRTASYVGAVGIYNAVQFGVDPRHGRVYLMSGGGISGIGEGLIVADTGPTPADQGRAFRTYASHNSLGAEIGSNIAVDGQTGRLWIAYTGATEFLVLRDRIPHYVPPSPVDPDRATIDVAEAAGRTGADFSAAAQAYGAVYRQVGGIGNVVLNVTPLNEPGAVPIGLGTRELMVGYLDKLSLDNRTASASAIGADRDRANTQTDEQRPPPEARQEWPYERAACGDFGGSAATVDSEGSAVACNAGKQSVSALAVGDVSSASTDGAVGPLVAVAHSGIEAGALRTPRDGVVSTVTSKARGISVLGGVLRVGDVEVVAEARAHGRPGTAQTSFTRLVRRVELNGTMLCEAQCDPAQIAAQVNSALAGRVRIDFPLPDAKDAAGTPGGFQAVVRRGLAEHVESVQFNQQQLNRLEVPGMVITVFADNERPSRLVAYLAGASVEARYGIFLLGGPASEPGSRDRGGDSGGPEVLATDPGSGGAFDELAAVVATVPPAAADGPSAAPSGVLVTVREGLLLLLNGAGRAAALLAIWVVLLAPVYLSARRWLMLRRGTLERGTA
jgi:hypothetical protein